MSYKEPSLNTKMRRPGKELVDAVLSDQNQRPSMEPLTAPLTAGRASIKQEPDDSAWKPLGVMGGRTGEEDGEVGRPLTQKLGRMDGTQDTKADAVRLNSAAASHAISAMIEETRRKSLGTNGLVSAKVPFEPPSTASQATSNDSKTPAVKLGRKDDLAIFDFNESSPPTTVEPSSSTTATASSRSRIDLAKAARSARRHSAVPAPMASATEERRSESQPKQDGGLPAVHKRSASGSVRSSSSSNPSLGRNTTLTKDIGRGKRGTSTNTGTAVTSLVNSASQMSLASKIEADGMGTRAERAATRRKSMML